MTLRVEWCFGYFVVLVMSLFDVVGLWVLVIACCVVDLLVFGLWGVLAGFLGLVG